MLQLGFSMTVAEAPLYGWCSLIPRPVRCFQLHEGRGGPDIFSHVRDVKDRKVVEMTYRTWAQQGSEQQEELRYQVTYHTYLASGGQLLCTPSVELVVH